jgi:putative ABC transport system permease protein
MPYQRRPPRLPHWLIALAGLLVPRWRRREWRAEWDAEIWHAEQPASKGRERRGRGKVVRHSLGAFEHAFWLRKRGWLMDTLGQDLRFGVRMLMRHRLFSIIAILTLALGIGANAAVFTVVNAVLLAPLPFHEPARLYSIWETDAKIGGRRSNASLPDFFDWQDGSRAFAAMAAWRPNKFTVTGRGLEPQRVDGVFATPDLFTVLGVSPSIGRSLQPGNTRAARAPEVVISASLASQLAATRSPVVGSTLDLDDVAYAIVGIMPADFRFLTDADLWVPTGFDGLTVNGRGMHSYRVIGRLAAGVSPAAAGDQLAGIARQLQREYPESNAGRGAMIQSVRDSVVGGTRRTLILLFLAVGVVLLIACTNVANLLVGRAMAREREMAIRAAVGAGRLRLLRQMLTESVLLAAIGGAVGLLVADWAVRALVQGMPYLLPHLTEIAVDGRVIAFTIAVTLVTGVVFGLAPALHAMRPDLDGALREGRQSGDAGARGARRLRELLVSAEMSMAVLLVVAAGLLAQSFYRLQQVDPGFDPDRLLTFTLTLPDAAYPPAESSQTIGFYRDLLTRISGLPGVQSAAAAYAGPLDPGFTTSPTVEGHPQPPPGTEPEANFRPITPGYFHLIGARLVRGRLFGAADDGQHPGVAVINEEMARTFFPGENPIGQYLAIGWPAKFWKGMPGRYEIVGIVSNVKFAGPERGPEPAMYFPHAQTPFNGMSVLVKTAGDPLAILPGVRQAVHALDPTLPLSEVGTIEDRWAEMVSVPRFLALLLSLFACLAVALAAIGIYGVMAYAVTRRTHEIGVRMALGAKPADVVRLLVRQGLVQIAVGVVVGLVAAIALTRSMAGLLFGIAPDDPVTFAAVAALLGAIGLLAAWIPARRATRIDPVSALRAD